MKWGRATRQQGMKRLEVAGEKCGGITSRQRRPIIVKPTHPLISRNFQALGAADGVQEWNKTDIASAPKRCMRGWCFWCSHFEPLHNTKFNIYSLCSEI